MLTSEEDGGRSIGALGGNLIFEITLLISPKPISYQEFPTRIRARSVGKAVA